LEEPGNEASEGVQWGCPLLDFSDEVLCNDLHHFWVITHPATWREEIMNSSHEEVTPMSTTVTVATAHLDPCINKGVNSLHLFYVNGQNMHIVSGQWLKYMYSTDSCQSPESQRSQQSDCYKEPAKVSIQRWLYIHA